MVLLLLLLSSCSATPDQGTDPGPESVEFDAIPNTFDAVEALDVFDSAEVRADSFQDLTDANDVALGGLVDTDGAEDADSVTPDTASDVLVCGDVPKEGCPCDEAKDEPCCIMIAQGLSCEPSRWVDGVFVVEWGVFWDCGCIDDPEQCRDETVYPLCPWESREPYF